MRRIFWGSCRNWVLIDTLHYLSSRSAFSFEFAEILVIEKQLPDSVIQRVGESLTLRLCELAFECLKENSASWRLPESGSC